MCRLKGPRSSQDESVGAGRADDLETDRQPVDEPARDRERRPTDPVEHHREAEIALCGGRPAVVPLLCRRCHGLHGRAEQEVVLSQHVPKPIDRAGTGLERRPIAGRLRGEGVAEGHLRPECSPSPRSGFRARARRIRRSTGPARRAWPALVRPGGRGWQTSPAPRRARRSSRGSARSPRPATALAGASARAAPRPRAPSGSSPQPSSRTARHDADYHRVSVSASGGNTCMTQSSSPI